MNINLALEETDKLLPCPFCGGTELELCNTWTACYWIECQTCEAQVAGKAYSDPRRLSSHEKSKASAIAKWNTRSAVVTYRNVLDVRTHAHP